MDVEQIELLPCPFCGSRDIDPRGWASTDSAGPACDDCGAGAGGVGSTLEENIARWNTRPALTPPEGHVVVTRNEAGQAVAVTRQDNDGRILSVIAEIAPAEGYVLVPVETQRDAERFQWLKSCSREQYLLARGMFGLAEDAIDAVIRDVAKEGANGK